MSAELTDVAGGIVTARIAGKLTQPDLAALQNAAGEILKKQGKVRFLVVVENFEGFQRGGDWGDLSFQMQHDAQIEKMAIVGDKAWEEMALLFTSKGLRKFPIEYFAPADIAKARAWLAENSSQG